MNILKQSTAATIKFGPMIDDSDGKTAETTLSISQADIRLSKNGGDFAQTNNAAGATHDENGYYDIPLDTTDTGTLGRVRVAVSKSGALPVWQDFLIVTANVYDSLVGGSDKLDVNAAELGGTAQTGNDVGAGLEAVSDNVDAIKAKTDLLDTSAITVVSAVEGSTITILRGDTFNPPPLTNLGALTDYVSIDFTVKSDKLMTDDEATIRIRKNASGVGDGLLRLNGAAPTTETGSITIVDEATGDIAITLDETATKELSTGSYSYDVQLITATAVKTLTAGKLTVISDVTRAIA